MFLNPQFTAHLQYRPRALLVDSIPQRTYRLSQQATPLSAETAVATAATTAAVLPPWLQYLLPNSNGSAAEVSQSGSKY